MIQRIQSIYLFLSVILMGGAMMFIPVFNTSESLVMVTDRGLYLSLSLAAAILALISLFSFRVRRRQVVLNRLTIITSFVLFGLMITAYADLQGKGESQLNTAMVFPLINVILMVLANRGILKDEQLVRSADRMR